MGYHRAGFEVTGVDISPQPNYPFTFVQMDAIEFLKGNGHEFDAVHASPPCQTYSKMTNCRPGLAAEYPDLIDATRQALITAGKPWVIENVEGSPLKDPIFLCGKMFGRQLYRHRLFESSFELPQPQHPEHDLPASKAGHWTPGTTMSICGHVSPIKIARELMDISWTTRDELGESIPPYFTEWIGGLLHHQINSKEN